jgi:putative amidoligase enzyme
MSQFILPDNIKTEEGNTRRVGYEIEYSGVDLEMSAKLLQDVVGGDIEQESSYCFNLENKQFGIFRLELDASLLKDGVYKEYLLKAGINIDDLDLNDELDQILSKVASTVVPNEIVTPPIPMDEMAIVDDIVTALRRKEAEGTRASMFYAFGLHINPELASTKTDYLLSHIRSFTVLFDWICKETKVDLSRKISPYIQPYPDEYARHVLQADYAPDIEQLINDYLDLVGSRNFALDMLPAFAHINEKDVMNKAKEKALIKPRPAFHYRLANSMVDEHDWSVADEWLIWMEIEKLAADTDKLKEHCQSFLKQLDD